MHVPHPIFLGCEIPDENFEGSMIMSLWLGFLVFQNSLMFVKRLQSCMESLYGVFLLFQPF